MLLRACPAPWWPLPKPLPFWKDPNYPPPSLPDSCPQKLLSLNSLFPQTGIVRPGPLNDTGTHQPGAIRQGLLRVTKCPSLLGNEESPRTLQILSAKTGKVPDTLGLAGDPILRHVCLQSGLSSDWTLRTLSRLAYPSDWPF